MKEQTIETGDYDTRYVKINSRLLWWIFAWVGTMLLVDKAEFYEWYSSDYISMAGIAINAGIGLGMIVTFMRYLREIDELQRKIQLEAKI